MEVLVVLEWKRAALWKISSRMDKWIISVRVSCQTNFNSCVCNHFFTRVMSFILPNSFKSTNAHKVGIVK